MTADAFLVGLTEELHRRLETQARNLLFPYRCAANNRGMVPHEEVERLMRLYGSLIAAEIWANITPKAPIQKGDVIEFTASTGHPVFGGTQNFIGRVESDARGLYACNHYQIAWKNPRIIERRPLTDLKMIPC